MEKLIKFIVNSLIKMRKKPNQKTMDEINALFLEAEKSNKATEKSRLEEARKTVKKARTLAKQNNVLLLEKWKDKFCHKCKVMFNVKNRKIRLNKGKISVKCLACGHFSRRKFKKNK